MRAKRGLYNIIAGFLGQLIILALGILVPRFILKSYGDEANGLVSAIGQLFTYLALIESGIGQAALQSLYKPIVNDDKEEISSVMATARSTYRRLTLVYCIIVIVVAVAYPLFIKVEDKQTINFFGSTYFAVMAMVLIQGASSALTFYFVSTIRQLMIADGRNYIIVHITTTIKILTSVAKIVLINCGINLVLLQFVYLSLSILEVIIYCCIIKKKYGWINWKAKKNERVASERKYFVVHEISNVIFSSTDVLILSIFCDLKVASVYAIFNMVFAALNTLISQVHSGTFYVLGQAYGKDEKEYVKVHDTYDTIYISCVFAVISVAYLLINPFINLYTAGVTDVNYADGWLALAFCVIQLLSCCRITSSNLIKIAGHARKTINRAIIEASINIVLSLILVQFLDVYGVLIGTIVALLYRTNDMVLYANKRILSRKPVRTYTTIGCNALLFIGVVIFNYFISLPITSYGRFFLWGVVLALISLFIYLSVNLLINRQLWKYIKNIFKNKKGLDQ